MIAKNATYLVRARTGRPSCVTYVSRRWFRQGSTYHSVSVYADGSLIARSSLHYGGEGVEESTAAALVLAVYPDLPDPSDVSPRRYFSDLGIVFDGEGVPVARRKDL